MEASLAGPRHLAFAVAFLFAIAWALAFGVEGAGRFFNLSLDLESYVRQAVADPWTSGLWASFMVLSTLAPTAAHFVLALGALVFALSGNPIGRWCAGQLRMQDPAHDIGPLFYFTFAWTVPVLAVPLALAWLLVHLFALAEPLPDALLATALNGIATAQTWF